jgi:hypothetical protein
LRNFIRIAPEPLNISARLELVIIFQIASGLHCITIAQALKKRATNEIPTVIRVILSIMNLKKIAGFKRGNKAKSIFLAFSFAVKFSKT